MAAPQRAIGVTPVRALRIRVREAEPAGMDRVQIDDSGRTIDPASASIDDLKQAWRTTARRATVCRSGPPNDGETIRSVRRLFGRSASTGAWRCPSSR